MAPSTPSRAAFARASGPLAGAIRVPGDKSISHRALMLGALAIGRTEITGLLEGEDILATAAALNALGAAVRRLGDGRWRVDGIGVGALQSRKTFSTSAIPEPRRASFSVYSRHTRLPLSLPAMHPCGGGRWAASSSR